MNVHSKLAMPVEGIQLLSAVLSVTRLCYSCNIGMTVERLKKIDVCPMYG